MLVNPLEWPIFVRHVVRRPWHGFRYALELAALVGRRLVLQRRLRRQQDPHKGSKQRPDWLPPARHREERAPVPFCLPSLTVRGVMPVVPNVAFKDDDQEAVYQQHRWGCCIRALGDEKAARLALRDALAWIARAPELTHPAWEAYSSSERVANLAVLLAVYPNLLADDEHAAVFRFLCQSAAWIDGHLEYYGPVRTNNHFLNNARALVLAGVMTSCQAWVDTGLEITRRFAPLLFPEDGCLREGASHYQLVVAGWLFDVLAFSRGVVQDNDLLELECLALQVGNACARFAAILPGADMHIGDISPDLHPQLSLARLQLLYPERMVLAQDRGRLGDWLFARRGPDALVARAVGGWPCPYTTHEHPDLGAFVWLRQSQWVLVDPGRASYVSCASTSAQIEAAAHNVMLVNGRGGLAESVLSAGIWRPLPYAAVLVDRRSNADGIEIEHDGYARLAGAGRYTRSVRMKDDALEVTDHLEGCGLFDIDVLWHFAPGFLESGQLRVSSATGSVRVDVTGPENGCWKWGDYLYSDAYGRTELAKCLRFSWQASLPCKIQTNFIFAPCAE